MNKEFYLFMTALWNALNRHKIKLFFLAVAFYLSFIAFIHQPAVHYFYDSVGIRDACTRLPNLELSTKLSGNALPFAAFKHIEGPGQFLVINIWCTLVGDLFPLNPTTTAIPNIILFWLACWIAFLLISKKWIGVTESDSERSRFAIFFVLVLATSSWVGPSLRLPWVFVSLSICIQTIVFYSLKRFFDATSVSEQKRWATFSGLSIGTYLYSGPDWPAFLSIVPIFILLSGWLHKTLRTRILFIVAFYFLAAWLTIRWLKLYHGIPSHDTVFMHVFSKGGIPFPGWERVKFFAVQLVGPVLFLALIEIVRSVVFLAKETLRSIKVSGYKGVFETIKRNALLITMIGWFYGASKPLFGTSVTLVYAYVLGLPMVYLAARLLTAIRFRWVSYAVVVILALFQFNIVTKNSLTYEPADIKDERILAMAAYLNEYHVDLLVEGKSALLVRDIAVNAGHHARGRYEKIIMPINFPIKLSHASVGNSPVQLAPIVETVRKKKELTTDWVIVNSELLSAELNPRTYEFYTQLSEVKNITWLIVLEDELGRKIWFGRRIEKNEKPVMFNEARVESVSKYAKIYNSKYNRISFLKNDLNYMLHY